MRKKLVSLLSGLGLVAGVLIFTNGSAGALSPVGHPDRCVLLGFAKGRACTFHEKTDKADLTIRTMGLVGTQPSIPGTTPCNPFCVNYAQLTSHGGAGVITAAPKVYIDYWGSQWVSGWSENACLHTPCAQYYSNSTAETYITDLYSGIRGSLWANNMTQYCNNASSGSYSCTPSQTLASRFNRIKSNYSPVAANTWVDNVTLPADPSDTDIFNEASAAATHFGGYVAGMVIVVVTPHGNNPSQFGASYCAYHGYDTVSKLPYIFLPYSSDAFGSCGMNFVNSTNNAFGNGHWDGWSMAGVHEYAEFLTDSDVATGWIDPNIGAEDGDLCAWNPYISKNATISTGTFAMQGDWTQYGSTHDNTTPDPARGCKMDTPTPSGDFAWFCGFDANQLPVDGPCPNVYTQPSSIPQWMYSCPDTSSDPVCGYNPVTHTYQSSTVEYIPSPLPYSFPLWGTETESIGGVNMTWSYVTGHTAGDFGWFL